MTHGTSIRSPQASPQVSAQELEHSVESVLKELCSNTYSLADPPHIGHIGYLQRTQYVVLHKSKCHGRL